MNGHITSHSDVFNEQFHHKKKKKESASKSTSRFQVFISSAFILHNGIQKTGKSQK